MHPRTEVATTDPDEVYDSDESSVASDVMASLPVHEPHGQAAVSDMAFIAMHVLADHTTVAPPSVPTATAVSVRDRRAALESSSECSSDSSSDEGEEMERGGAIEEEEEEEEDGEKSASAAPAASVVSKKAIAAGNSNNQQQPSCSFWMGL